jgi:hypothetical protein
MKNLILSAAILVASIVGTLTWTQPAEARPRGYYRAPAVRYYRPYYGYGGYYRPYYRSYYGYGGYYRPYYGSYYYGPRVYLGFGYPYYGGGYYYRW